MSGHSKWHNIRLKKARWTLSAEKRSPASPATSLSPPEPAAENPDSNIRLRYAIQKAREASMPGRHIKRAVQRGAGEVDGAVYDEITYEGYASGGVAVLVECMTDNKQRTVADVRSYFNKTGGRLGESGSVGTFSKQKASLLSMPTQSAK